MDEHPETYHARRPRHQAIASTTYCFHIERDPGNTSRSVDATLLDLSSSGAGLRVLQPLEVGEPIAIHLRQDTSRLLLTASGTVRWVSPDEQGGWLVGCLLDRPLDWETLGELFLEGVLSTDRPALPLAPPSPAEAPAAPA